MPAVLVSGESSPFQLQMTTFSMSAQREREREGFDVSSYKDTNPMGPGPHLDEFI